VQRHLASYDASRHRWTLVAGVNQKTVTGATFDRARDEVVFESTFEGDGTVPLRFARVPAMPTYFVEETHGQLCNHAVVAKAVVDILDHGSTDQLPTEAPPRRRAAPEHIGESALRAIDPFADAVPIGSERARTDRRAGVRRHLRSADLRNVLAGYAGPGSSRPMADRPQSISTPEKEQHLSSETTPWKNLVVGRARQHRLDIQIANCSITQVSARAYVLGLFREVTPTGAASAIDEALEGAVTEFTRRRMFSGGVAEMFMLPANRSRMRTEMVLFAGLGFFDQFNDEVQQTTAEHVIRTFVRTHVEDFATVLFGGGSGTSVEQLLVNLLKGFVRGKLDADTQKDFRRVTICELDKARYVRIRDELYRLASTPLFEDIEVTFTELTEIPREEARVEVPMERAHVARSPDPVYLIVRREREQKGTVEFGASLLTAGAKAAILSATSSVKTKQLDAQLAKTARNGFDSDDGRALGEFLADHLLDDAIRDVLPRMKDRHVVVVHDGPASRIPWETLRIGSWQPALVGGMSRRYMAENLSVAKYLEQRERSTRLRALLVVNPTEDLPGAQKEGKRIGRILGERADVELKTLEKGRATRRALLKELSSGKYDLVHYAGHAFFDIGVPERSGLLCAGEEVLTGTDLSQLGNLPQLVFFNACESGRLRKRGARTRAAAQKSKSKSLAPGERVAPAEAFLRGGVANFLGTYWSVGDDSAEAFSSNFYSAFLAGETIGTAILAGRKSVNADDSVDWSDFIHYGDHTFRMFTPRE